MNLHIALLRGVNVGGNNLIAMADLRALVTGLGFTGAKTLLQSGNLVFSGGRRAPAALERALEKAIHAQLGLTLDCVVRTVAEWDAIIARNPFPTEARTDPSHLVVHALRVAPTRKRIEAMLSALPGREVVVCNERELYIVYPDGIGKSKLNMAWIERHVGCSGTARNWNTVVKLAALARE